MKKEKIKKILKVGGPLSMPVIGVIIGIMVLSNSNPIAPVVVEKKGTYVTLPFLPLGDATPGNDSGVLMVCLVDTGNLYGQLLNRSWNATAAELSVNANHLGHTDTNESSAGTNISSTNAFSIIVKVRYNTDYYDTAWRVDYANASFSCVDNALSPTVISEPMGKHIIALGDDYMWIWYEYNNSASGFTIGSGLIVENTNAKVNVSGYSYG